MNSKTFQRKKSTISKKDTPSISNQKELGNKLFPTSDQNKAKKKVTK